MLVRRCIPFLIAFAITPLAANGQTFDTLYEYGNAANSSATSGAGIARGADFSDSASGNYTITAGGTDFWSNSDHGSAIFDSTAAPVTGNFSAVVKVQIGLEGESMPGEWGRTGIQARTDPTAANSAYFASTQKFDGAPGATNRRQHILQARDAAGSGTGRPSNGSPTTLVTGPTAAAAGTDPVPVWLALHRYNGGIYSTWAPDDGGAPGSWSAAESRDGSDAHNGPVQLGLFHQNHNVQPETSTATFMAFSSGAFDNNLGAFPSVITRSDLTLTGGNLTGDFFGVELGGGDKQAVEWMVELLGDATTVPGLTARSYLRGNGGSFFDTSSADPNGIGQLANIAWAGNANPPPAGLEKYPDIFNLPSDTDSDGDNQEGYTVDLQGEIFIPEAGTYKFKDGVDDYTYLQIDGETLIDDNTWTGIDGTANGGSPIVEKTFASAGWKSFRFQMAEGGGGDAGALYWDYNNGAFPASNTDPAGLEALVPADNFRTSTFAVDATISGTSVQEGVLTGDGGSMLSADAGQLARVTINGVPQIVQVVPEPSSIALCVLGALGLLSLRRRRR